MYAYSFEMFLFIAMTVSVVSTSSVDSSDLVFPSSELQNEATNVTLSNMIQIPFTSLSELATVSGKSQRLHPQSLV